MAHTLSPWRSNRAFLFLFLQLSFFILVLWRELCQCVNTNTHIDMWCWRWPVQSEKGVPVEGVKPTPIFTQSEPPGCILHIFKAWCLLLPDALSEECECPTKEKTPTQPCFSKRYHTTCWHVLIWQEFDPIYHFLTLEKRFVYATQCQMLQSVH